MSKIINTNQPFELEVKRFRVPGIIIETECKNCGTILRYDMETDYFCYPIVNQPFQTWIYCDECDEETTINLQIRIDVQLVQ